MSNVGLFGKSGLKINQIIGTIKARRQLNKFWDWLLGIPGWMHYGGLFWIPPYGTLLFYVFLGIAILIVNVLIHLKFVMTSENRASADRKKRSSFLESALRIIRWIGYIIGAVVMAPLAEELLFRGVIIWLAKNASYSLALSATLTTSIAFGLSHKLNPWHVTWRRVYATMTMGGTLALVTLATLSLWPAIFAHASWNLSCKLISVDRMFRWKQKLQW